MDQFLSSSVAHESSAQETAAACAQAISEAAGRTPPTLIVNADDWGRDEDTTSRILDCVLQRAVSSVSAMVFMADSERAADFAGQHDMDAGLHLNLDLSFSAARVPQQLQEHQQRTAAFLKTHRYAPAIFSPALASSFEYVVRAQIDEYERLYGAPVSRLDGHHHAHLCANVLFQKLLPGRSVVRRNFTFRSGQKSVVNRAFRSVQDRALARRHSMTGFLFALVLDKRDDLYDVMELARIANVELETHPGRLAERDFLIAGGLQEYAQDLRIARGYLLRSAESFAWDKMHPRAAALEERVHPPSLAFGPASVPEKLPHICVCICTYKRPHLLSRLLADIDRQETGGQFTHSIVVVDNDEAKSAESIIETSRAALKVPVKYCVEPRRGIARARNKTIENAEGDFVALIDDDEFPLRHWLLTLLKTCRQYGVDGVLGPVRRHFAEEPPAWLRKSSLYDRPVHPTGTEVAWRRSRTGNALLRRSIFCGDAVPFRPEFRAGEDQDFFRRQIERGRLFVWSAGAQVFETIPPARWRRRYFVRKALIQGENGALQGGCNVRIVAKSIIAIVLYALGLPFALLAGQHRFMTLLVKLCDHTGRLLTFMKVRPIREEYVSE